MDKRVWSLCVAAAALFLTQCESEPPPDATSGASEPVEIPYFPPPDNILIEGEAWEQIPEAYGFKAGLVWLPENKLLFSEMNTRSIQKLNGDGTLTQLDAPEGQALGMALQPGGELVVCFNEPGNLQRREADGSWTLLAEGEPQFPIGYTNVPKEYCNDVAVNDAGRVWYTERALREMWTISPEGEHRKVSTGFRPNGISLIDGQQSLAVSDSSKPIIRRFDIQPDGSLVEREGFFEKLITLEYYGSQKLRGGSGANGITTDDQGRLFITTYAGIQVYDTEGRNLGVIDPPPGYMSSIVFGGENYDTLYVGTVGGLWKRKINATGRPSHLLAESAAE